MSVLSQMSGALASLRQVDARAIAMLGRRGVDVAQLGSHTPFFSILISSCPRQEVDGPRPQPHPSSLKRKIVNVSK